MGVHEFCRFFCVIYLQIEFVFVFLSKCGVKAGPPPDWVPDIVHLFSKLIFCPKKDIKKMDDHNRLHYGSLGVYCHICIFTYKFFEKQQQFLC